MTKWIVGSLLFFLSGYFVGKNLAPNQENEVSSLQEKVSELEAQLKNDTMRTTAPRENSANRATAKPSPAIAPQELMDARLEPEKEKDTLSEPKPKNNWRAAEKTFPNVRTQGEIQAFLENVRINDFLSEVQSVQPITQNDPLIEQLNGNFTGTMSTQSEVPNFNISMQANISSQSQSLRGRMSIRLSRNGRAFSRGSSSGDIQNVQKFGEKSLAVVIYAGDFYFQLYYLPSLDSFEGNCYQQFKPGSMRFVGTVHLERL